MAEFAEELSIARGFLAQPGEPAMPAGSLASALDLLPGGTPALPVDSSISDKDDAVSERPTKGAAALAALMAPVPLDKLPPPTATSGTTAAATTTGALSKSLVGTAMTMCVALGVVGTKTADAFLAGVNEPTVEAAAKDEIDVDTQARFERLERKIEVLEQQIAAAASTRFSAAGSNLASSPGPAPEAAAVPTSPPSAVEKSATRAPSPRQRAIVRDLGTVAADVGVCFRRHGGNLESQLPVRVVISALGRSLSMTLRHGAGQV